MNLEVAIFVPHGGQHRAGVHVTGHPYSIEVVKSSVSSDYKFSVCVTHRSAPTFTELFDSPRLPIYKAALAKAVKEHIVLVSQGDRRMRTHTCPCKHPTLGDIVVLIEISW